MSFSPLGEIIVPQIIPGFEGHFKTVEREEHGRKGGEKERNGQKGQEKTTSEINFWLRPSHETLLYGYYV